MRSWSLAAFLVGLAAFVVFAAVPYFQTQHEFPASITSPPPRLAVSLVRVKPHGRMCMDKIAIEPLSRVARFRVGTFGKPGPPLRVELSGRGYSQTRRVAGGWPDNALQAIRVTPPRQPELLRVCIANEGNVKIAFYAAGDRAESRSTVRVDGKRVKPTPQFGFWEGGKRTIADRLSQTVDRIAVLRGPLGHPWLVWAILVLALLALTAGMGAVLWLSGE